MLAIFFVAGIWIARAQEDEAKKRSEAEAIKREEMVARMKQEETHMGALMEELGQLPQALSTQR